MDDSGTLNLSRTFQDLPGVRTVPSHLEVSAPTPHGNWCEIWRKTSELLKALAISRRVSQKVLKCLEIFCLFFYVFFLCFFDLMQAVHPTHLTSFDKTVTVPRLHPASRIFIGLLLPERCVASTHGIANAVYATR